MTWREYVEKVTDDGPTAIAARIGVTPPSVSRWWGSTARPRPEHTAAFARAYGRPVLESFVAAGFLTSDEAGERPSAMPSLATLSDEQLLAEVLRRMQGGSDVGNAEAEKSPTRADYALAARRGHVQQSSDAIDQAGAGEENQDDGDFEPA